MSRSLHIAAALASVAALAWLVIPQRPPQPEHLVDRVWIDHLPDSPTDLVTHLVVLKERKGHAGGLLGRSSEWRITFDLFSRKLSADSMEMFFPQANERVRVGVRTWKCKGEAKEPFELCLELKAGRRTIKLYSREDWIIPDGVPAELRFLAPSLAPSSALDDVTADDAIVLREALPRALARE